MAIRIVSVATAAKRAGAPSGANPYTLFARVRVDVATSFGALLAMVDTGNLNQNGVFLNGVSFDLIMVGNTTSAAFFTARAGTWCDIAVTCAGGTGLTALVGYAQHTGSPLLAATGTAQPLATTTVPQIYVGQGTGGEVLNGAAADVMVWTTQLTADEIEQQRRSRMPVVQPEKLWSWVPCTEPGTMLDVTGNARHFTTATTLSAEDPPLTFPSRKRSLADVVAGGGGGAVVSGAGYYLRRRRAA